MDGLTLGAPVNIQQTTAIEQSLVSESNIPAALQGLVEYVSQTNELLVIILEIVQRINHKVHPLPSSPQHDAPSGNDQNGCTNNSMLDSNGKQQDDSQRRLDSGTQGTQDYGGGLTGVRTGGRKRPGNGPLPDLTEAYVAELRTIPLSIPNAPALVSHLVGLCETHKSVSRVRESKVVLVEFCAKSHEPPNPRDLARYLAVQMSMLSEGVIKRKYGIIRQFLQAVFKWRDEDFPRLHNERRRARPKPTVPRIPRLTVAEMKRVHELSQNAATFPSFFPFIIRIMYHAGLHLSDALDLRWQDLLSNGSGGFSLVLKQPKNGQPTVPIPTDLGEELLRLRRDQRPEERLFNSSKGGVNHYFRKLSISFGKEVRSRQVRRAEGSLVHLEAEPLHSQDNAASDISPESSDSLDPAT